MTPRHSHVETEFLYPAEEAFWTEEVKYEPVFKLGENMRESIVRMAQVEDDSTQLVTVISSQAKGVPVRWGSLFSAMQSSPAEMEQSEIRTRREQSISSTSVLGPLRRLCTWMLWIVISSQPMSHTVNAEASLILISLMVISRESVA